MQNAFTWVFVLMLAAASAARLWLSQRQVGHVRAHRGAVPQTFASSIPLEAHQKAADYTVAKARFGMVDVLVGAALTLGLTLGGFIQWSSDLWSRWTQPDGLLHGSALILTVFFAQGAVGLPLGLYRTFVIEERFGFNRMTLRLFMVDLVKQVLVGLVLGVPLLVVVLWLMERAGPWWWLYGWVIVAGYSLVLHMIIPSFVLPLFNKFSPLEDAALAERVERLLERCGFRSRGLYVMDGSKRSSHGNAFFTGFGASKRIVLFDTLVSRLAPDEVEAVLAHELGHYKLHHIVKGIALSWALAFAMLFALGVLIREPWFYDGLGARTHTNAVALVLFMIALPEFLYFFQPLTALFSRRHEFQADGYATLHSSAASLVQALVKLYKDNAATLTPDPLHSAFYDSHPPAAARIARLRTP